MPKANLVCEARETGHVRVYLVRNGKFRDGVEMSGKELASWLVSRGRFLRGVTSVAAYESCQQGA